MTQMLSDREHWQVRNLLAAMGEGGASAHLGVAYRELVDAIYPGVDDVVLSRIRERLRGGRRIA